MKLSVVIQAGGESRRMGQNKALIHFLGQPLIQRIVNRLSPIADEIIITSNQPDALAFLQIPVFSDIIPGRGVLSGLYTAFSVSRHPLAAVIACDMAFVSPALITAERSFLDDAAIDGVVPLTASGYEPFHAVYRRETCLPAVKDSLEKGQMRADSWFSSVRMLYLNQTEITRIDPKGEAFFNINTPAELSSAEAYAAENDSRKSRNNS